MNELVLSIDKIIPAIVRIFHYSSDDIIMDL